MSEETEAPEDVAVEEAPEQTEVRFTQKEVNDIVAREVSKTKRQAKKAQTSQPKQEPTTGVGDTRVDALAEQVQTVAEMLKSMSDKQAASESASLFSADIAGLEISETEKAMLKAAREGAPEAYAARLAELRAKDHPPTPKGEGHKGVGAPNPAPNAPSAVNPAEWSRDDIAAMKTAGTFRKNLDAARAAMPGGSGGLFKARK